MAIRPSAMEMLGVVSMVKLNYAKPNNNFWKGKKVLITGHNGFKGSWLSLWLLKMNALVSGISLDQESRRNLFNELNIEKDLNHILCDIRDKESLKRNIDQIKPDILFHLAAQPLVIDSYINPISTWETNVIGTLNLLDSITSLRNECIGIFITTDKVYKNNEWIYGYRENDQLGGHDPYSSSKAACEIAISSWRSSFLNPKKQNRFFISSARAGNVIGGGDWAENRIIPDVVRALEKNEKILVRNPLSTRPWQHVLEPLSGYLLLAESLSRNNINFSTPFNFGPLVESNRSVQELVKECLEHWQGEFIIDNNANKLHEAGVLNLTIEKAIKELNWHPKWDFNITIKKTINWYKNVLESSKNPIDCSLSDLNDYLID